MIRSAISQWMQGATRHFPLGPAAAENWNATFPGMETNAVQALREAWREFSASQPVA
jgi:hypothetical protein